jgi:DNA invertase Pin-like site-specific DNA recombinase
MGIMARVGYIRVSTADQNIERQVYALSDVSKTFIDRQSGKDTNRPELQAMLSYIREGDTVVITELDRLGRNNQDLTAIMEQIHQKKATLEVLNLPTLQGIEDDNLRRLINTLMLEIYKYQAESERKRIKERQAQGIALAKQRGVYKGRKPKFTMDDERLLHALELSKSGLSDAEVSRRTGINRTTFGRYKKRLIAQKPCSKEIKHDLYYL